MHRGCFEGSRLNSFDLGFDVIHGYPRLPFLRRTATWDPVAVERNAAIAAKEARASGVHWTFAPMVDIARDARWGRIAEGSGEDPFLGSVMARARVLGFQGSDYSAADKVVACAKHWVAYALPKARDPTRRSFERTLLSFFLPSGCSSMRSRKVIAPLRLRNPNVRQFVHAD